MIENYSSSSINTEEGIIYDIVDDIVSTENKIKQLSSNEQIEIEGN